VFCLATEASQRLPDDGDKNVVKKLLDAFPARKQFKRWSATHRPGE